MLRLTGEGLKSLTSEELATGMQASDSNPLTGVEGRASLLRSLGNSLLSHAEIFGEDGRPGKLVGK